MASISVAQYPLEGTGQNHNILLFRDDSGRIFAEMDGGPVGPDGNIILFGSNNPLQAFNAYTSGQYPLGVKTYPGPAFYRRGQQETKIFSGSQSDVDNRFNAAKTAADQINAAGFRYALTGADITDRDSGQQISAANSNGVNSTLIQAMGIDPGTATLPTGSALGFGREILSSSQIRDIVSSIPSTGIPIPTPDPRKGIDNQGGSGIPLPLTDPRKSDGSLDAPSPSDDFNARFGPSNNSPPPNFSNPFDNNSPFNPFNNPPFGDRNQSLQPSDNSPAPWPAGKRTSIDPLPPTQANSGDSTATPVSDLSADSIANPFAIIPEDQIAPYQLPPPSNETLGEILSKAMQSAGSASTQDTAAENGPAWATTAAPFDTATSQY
jgi:hypothetical protein